MDCHIVAEPSMLLLPKARKSNCGDALTSESTTLFRSPAGDIAGARAMKTSTLSLRVGCIDNVANACAVPCENPIYDKEAW